MEIKSGFRQSGIGVIPEDWEVKHIGDLGSVVRGGSPRPAGDPRYFNGSYIPWLTVTSLTNIPESQQYVSETQTCLTQEGARHSRTLQPGTLAIVNSGARTLGVAKIVSMLCCANDGIAALVDQHSGDKNFISYYLNSQIRRLRDIVAAGNDQLNLNTTRIANLQIPFPPEDEQRVISSVLGDIDDLISTLNSLITKKRAIKHATMQHLLTGRQRIPGFDGPWGEIAFGKAAMPRKERMDPRFGGPPTFCVELEHIGQGTGSLIGSTMSSSSVSLKTVFQAGDVLFGKLRPYLRKFWLADRNGVCSSEIWSLRSDPRLVAPEFLFHVVGLDSFIDCASTAYGTHMPRADWHVVKHYKLTVPPLPEQTAIANVLSDMDAEIAALEQRRDKTRAMKQGMMQELLTGRTRLVDGATP